MTTITILSAAISRPGITVQQYGSTLELRTGTVTAFVYADSPSEWRYSDNHSNGYSLVEAEQRVIDLANLTEFNREVTGAAVVEAAE